MAVNDAVPPAVLSHLAHELNARISSPFSIESSGRALMLLEATGRSARLVASVELGEALEELETSCERLEIGLDELRDDVAMALRARWPLDEGAGGRPECIVESGVLRVAFRGPTSEIRLADFDLADVGNPRISG